MQKILNMDVRPTEKTKEILLSFVRGELGETLPISKITMLDMEAVANILSKGNLKLLKIIREQQPSSIGQLAFLSDRAPGDVSKALSKMIAYGLVRMEESKVSKAPRVDYESIQINISI